MTIDLDDLPEPLKFAYMATTRTAIYIKELGQDKNFFLSFCNEIWVSMEMTDLETLKEILEGKMEKDIKPYVESYVKNKYKKEI